MEVIVATAPTEDLNLIATTLQSQQDEIHESIVAHGTDEQEAEMNLSMENVFLTMTNRERVVESSEAAQDTIEETVTSSSSSEEMVLEAKLENVDLKKILKNVFSEQDDEDVKLGSSSEEEYMLFKLLREGTKDLIDVNRNEEEDDEIEVEFERVVKELDDHDVHCPKCNSCITKIVLRKKKRVNLNKSSRFNFLGCLSCFSVIIPSENCFSFLNIFKKPDVPMAVTSEVVPTNPSSSVSRDPIEQITGDGTGTQQTKPDKGPGQDLSAAGKPPKLVANNDGNHFENLFPATTLPISTNTSHPPSHKPIYVSGGGGGAFAPPTSGISIAGGTAPGGGNQADLEQGLLTPVPEETPSLPRARSTIPLEILKSIVYGGLMETIASFAIVTSAAAADAKTVNIVAMGLANLVAGLFAMLPSLRELKKQQPEAESGVDRYQETLGKRENYVLHATFVVLSFVVFGLIPPVAYGSSFRATDDKDYKLAAVAAAAFVSVALLAIAKAYTQKVPKFYMYLQTVLYYVTIAAAGSGISFVVGDFANKFMLEHGWFDTTVPAGLSTLSQSGSVGSSWGSY